MTSNVPTISSLPTIQTRILPSGMHCLLHHKKIYSKVAAFTSCRRYFSDHLVGIAFYASLGSPRLTRIVKEEVQTSQEIQNSKHAQETRTLILERLPLFLHEQTQTATRVSYSWLSSGNNFIVKAFGKLTVVKHLNFDDIHSSRKQDASAVSRKSSGSIELWLAANGHIDMYE